MLIIGPMHNNQSLAQSDGIARVKSRVPLFVFLTKAHHNYIRLLNPVAGANSVELSTLAIIPKLISLRA